MEAEGRRDAKKLRKLEIDRECAAKRALQTSWMRSYFTPKESNKHQGDKMETINMDRNDVKTDTPSVNSKCGPTTPKYIHKTVNHFSEHLPKFHLGYSGYILVTSQ